MGIAAGVAAAAAAGTLGLNISNSMSGGGGSPAGYMPGNPGFMDTQYNNIVGGQVPYAQQLPGFTIPGFNAAAMNIQNNPYSAAALGGAQQAASLGPGVAGMQLGGAQGLYGAGSAGVPYATQILNTGFDPQSALFDKLQQQVRDQANVSNAMSGVQGPYAAGTANQALTNFDLAWQNAQLGRQAQAAQGYGNLISGAGRGFAGASDLGTAGLQTLPYAAQLPYSAYLGQQSDVLGGLGNVSSGYGNVFSAQGGVLNPIAAYLKLGQGATQLGQQAQATNFNQQAALGQGLGQSLAGFGNSLSQLFAPTNNQNMYPYATQMAGIAPDQFAYGGGGGYSTFPPGP